MEQVLKTEKKARIRKFFCFYVYQNLVKFIWFQLIFCLLATAMEQVLKTEKKARIRKFSCFYDKPQPAVCHLALAVNAKLNLSNIGCVQCDVIC